MKYLLLFFIFLFVSCKIKNQDSKNNTPPIVNYEISLFNYSFLYNDYEDYYSFPIWFNDSLIKSNNIHQIKRSIFYIDLDSNNQNINKADKITQYTFDKNGLPTHLNIQYYYDNQLFNTSKIEYSNHNEQLGYAKIKNMNISHENMTKYMEFEIIEYTTKKTVLFNKKNDFKIFIIPDSSHWKPLTIDTLCHPAHKDIIVWGTLKKPYKIYSVKNLVEENNVRIFLYKDNSLINIQWNDIPFDVNRHFIYNQSGICTSFIDSTFSMGNFISKTIYNIKLTKNLPSSITKERKDNKGNKTLYKETFEYFFEQ